MNKNKIPTIGVIILNWNLADDTIKCVKSLQRFIKSGNLTIVVIDNDSLESDVSKLESLENTVLIKNRTNVGYAKANNQGIKFFLKQNTKPDYILLMNNDAYCVDDFLKPLLKVMKDNPQVGSLNPMIYFSSQPKKIWSSGGVLDLEKGEISANYLDYYKEQIKNKISPYKVDWTSGCVNLMPTVAVIKSGYLSEALYMYSEDLEYSLRLKEENYLCMVVPASKIYHHVSKSSGGSGSTTSRYYISRNSMVVAKLYIKNYKNFIFLNFFSQIRHSLQGRYAPILLAATAKGIYDGLKWNRSIVSRETQSN